MNEFEVDCHKKFKKEKRKFFRKCPSLEIDFDDFLTALKTDIKYNNYEVPTDNNKYFKIKGLSADVSYPAFVAKRFYCEKMGKGANSGFRLTFLYDKSEQLIYFVEFYFKGNKKLEDKQRIEKLFTH